MNTQDNAPSTDPLTPLERWLNDPDVVGIMVDGYNHVYVERRELGEQFQDVPTPFRDNEHLMQTLNAIAASYGKKVNESNPLLDVHLFSGSRLNAVIPPISLSGPVVTIRKFRSTPLTVDDLIRFGAWSKEIVEFVRACVRGRLNIVIAGGTASGKTTLLDIIADMIPDHERIIVIQHASELVLSKKRLVILETRPPNLEGRGEITVKDLTENALRMRPDRIILTELLPGKTGSGEALLEMIFAMNRGHEGTMMNMHAISPRDALTGMEMMTTSANPSLPLLTVRQQLASAIDLIIYQERLRDGTRKILHLAEVQGMQRDDIALQNIFEFRPTGQEGNRITGHFAATGYTPGFLDRIQAAGVDLPPDLFTPQ